MAFQKGSEFVVDLGSGPIAAFSTKTVNFLGDMDDITNDGSNNWRDSRPGLIKKGVDVQAEGFRDSSEFVEKYFSSDQSYPGVTLTWADGSVITGTFIFHSYSETHESNPASKFSMTISSKGEVTYTPVTP